MLKRTSLGNNRLNRKFQELSEKNEAALICYVVAGYPNIPTTNEILSSIVKGGADVIEIGIPFSDPIADGPTGPGTRGRTPPKTRSRSWDWPA